MSGYEKRLMRVLDHIHDHPAGDLSLDALAEVAALSRFHFHRVWRAMTGETAAQTMRRMRLHRAAAALVGGDAPLARIAREVGYPNAASFSRAFAELYGMPPSAFRERGEARAPLPLFTRGDEPMPDVTIREEPARRLAALPHRGSYQEIGRAFEKLGAAVAARGLSAQAGNLIGVYYDDPSSVPVAGLRSHAGAELPEAAAIDAPLEEVRLPAGRHAVLRHVGPYAELPAAYDRLYAVWLPQSGEEPADSPVFENYLNTPMEVAQDQLVTEICVPLKQR